MAGLWQRQVVALTGVLARTAGQAALRRGLALYSGLFILAVVLFWGKNAMNASELTGVARHSIPFRALLLGGWLVVSLPVVRALLASPSAFHVRAFPVPWAAAAMVLGVGLLVVEIPWTVLWFAGQGPRVGAGAVLIAAGAQASIVGRPRRWYELAATLSWLAAFLLGSGPSVALGVPAVVLGLRRAWISAAEPRLSPGRGRVQTRSPAIAVATAHFVSLWRGQRPLLARWLWLAAGGVGVAALAVRNNGVADRTRIVVITMCVLAPVTTLGALGLGRAMLRTERQGHWLLDLGGPARVTGTALAGAGYGLLFGAAHGLSIAGLVDGPSVRLVLSAAGEAAALAVVAVSAVRWADRGTGRDSGRVLLVALALSGGAIGLVVLSRELGVVLVAALAGALSLLLRTPRQPPRVLARAAADQD